MNTLILPGSIQLTYQMGIDANGKAILNRRTIKHINPEASDSSIFAIKDMLESVQEGTIESFIHSDIQSFSM